MYIHKVLQLFLAAIFCIFNLPQDTQAHTQKYSIITLEFDKAGSASLTIACHMASFLLEKPQRPLSMSERVTLVSLTKHKFRGKIENAKSMLEQTLGLRMGGVIYKPKMVSFPSAAQIRRDGLAMDTAEVPSLEIKMIFSGLPPAAEASLLVPARLDRTFVKVISPGIAPLSGFSNRGGGVVTFPLGLEEKPVRVFTRFISQGFIHVLPYGYDHLMFIIALCLLVMALKPVLLQVTLFTLAHSVTLALSVLGYIALPSAWTEFFIAASIAYVGLENIWQIKAGKPQRILHLRLIVVFVFGLIHGLGFAGALREIGIPPTQMFLSLAGFNLGVEAAQVTVIFIVVGLLALIGEKWRIHARLALSAVVALAGIYWAVSRIGMI